MTAPPMTPPAGAPPAGASPAPILQLATGFWASKTLLSAVELGLFTRLAQGPLSGAELREQLGVHARSAADFFDALVALGLLEREDGRYRNAPAADAFLDASKRAYVGGFLEMLNERLYPAWAGLSDGLRTGRAQSGAAGDEDLFDALYTDEEQLRRFLAGMEGGAAMVAGALAQRFDWSRHRTFVDAGGAKGDLSVLLARAHEHLSGGSFDLPPVGPIFDETVAAAGLADRLTFSGGDFFADPLPAADVVILGHVLHDWDLDKRKALIAKAFDALPEGGALIVYDALIDDDRSSNVFGLLLSLNMLIETEGGAQYTAAECCAWMREAGFREATAEPLAGPDSMVVGIK
jgi:O-methyltransferase/methyltransferase family protein